MKRREFIAALGVAAGWPIAVRAQQVRQLRRIAVLMGTVETAPDHLGLRGVFERLKALGWTDGVTADIEVRWSKTDLGLMRENAQALMALSPDVKGGQGLAAPIQNGSSALHRRLLFATSAIANAHNKVACSVQYPS